MAYCPFRINTTETGQVNSLPKGCGTLPLPLLFTEGVGHRYGCTMQYESPACVGSLQDIRTDILSVEVLLGHQRCIRRGLSTPRSGLARK
jgi:hypothetical protein